MLIIPAIDLRNGKCVRLVEGKLEQETVYSDNPVAQALAWQDKGAEFLHLVDLDGAFAGVPKNLEVIKAIVQAVDIPVQLGGGIRVMETIDALLEAGLNRVILGTVAIKNPQLVKEACAKYPGRIVVGIDSKDGLVAVEGWAEASSRTAVDLALEMKSYGVERIIYTDVSRDGTLQGPNLEATKQLAEATGMKVVASGGVSSLADIRDLMAVENVGVDAVILGKSIYTGAIELEEALELVKGAS